MKTFFLVTSALAGWIAVAVDNGPAVPAPITLVEKIAQKSWYCFAAGDLNGDRRPDLAIAVAPFDPTAWPGNMTALIYYWREGGTFPHRPDRKLPLERPPSGLVIGDFDKDGKNDLAVGQRSKREIVLFLGRDDFKKPIVNPDNNDSAGGGLAWGRLSANAKADFVNGATWRAWAGGGKFVNSYIRGPGGAHDNYKACLADFNWDGLDDIVFVNRNATTGNNEELRVYYGPFQSASIYSADWCAGVTVLKTGPCRSEQILIADLTGDDQPDIVHCVRENGAPKTQFFPQNQPIGFTNGAKSAIVLSGVGAPAAVGDFNGDGHRDLALSDPENNRVYVFFYKKDRTFPKTAEQADAKFPLSRRPLICHASGPNNDGLDELIILSDDGRVELFSFSPAKLKK